MMVRVTISVLQPGYFRVSSPAVPWAMTRDERRRSVGFWERAGDRTALSARALHEGDDPRGCANRAYYAAYQQATAVCLRHGDEEQFPHQWHNPSHEQVPDLLGNNGNLPIEARRRIGPLLQRLRSLRETADYRPGHSCRTEESLAALHCMESLFRLLKDKKATG